MPSGLFCGLSSTNPSFAFARIGGRIESMATHTVYKPGFRYTDTPCGRKIRDCEYALQRDLSEGEKVDLLLDNFMEIADSNESRQIVASVTKCRFCGDAGKALDQFGHCSACVKGMARTNGD